MCDWFYENQIQLNQPKTQLIVFCNPHKKVGYYTLLTLHWLRCKNCTCNTLTYCDTVKYLGIFFNGDMSWNSHLLCICAKLRKVSCILYSLRSFIPYKTRRTILESLGYSNLRYAITIFSHCSETWKIKIDTILKSRIKSVVYGCDVPDNSDPFTLVGFPRLENLFKYTVFLKWYWSEDYKIPSPITRTLRNLRDPYVLPYNFTRYGSYCRKYYVPFLFNNLPEGMSQVHSRRTLKRLLKQSFYRWCRKLRTSGDAVMLLKMRACFSFYQVSLVWFMFGKYVWCVL